jgi:hypothetical protein
MAEQSGRSYPMTLISSKQYIGMPGENTMSTDVVHNDIEYYEVVQTAKLHGYKIKVVKHQSVIDRETAETEAKKKREKTADNLQDLNLKNARRVYKTYPVTQGLAWTGAIIAILMALLKLAEVLKIWPYH